MVVLITNVITDYSLKIDIFNASENILIYSRADLTEFFQQFLDFLPLGIAAAVLVDFPFLGEAAGTLYKSKTVILAPVYDILFAYHI
jgi:branched-subunit amino acid transport protein